MSGLQIDKTALFICVEMFGGNYVPRRKTHEEFVKELSVLRPTIKLLGQYVNSSTKTLFKCDVCGYEWEVVPNTFVSTKSGCPRCANHEPLNTKIFIEKAKLKNNKVKVLGEYTGHNEKIDVQCVDCGKIWKMSPSNILGGCGCRECVLKKELEGRAKDPEVFKKELYELNPNILLLSDYERSDRKVECKCSICGYEWSTRPNALLSGVGCPSCANNISMTHDEFVEKAKKLNEYVDVIGIYVNSKTHILCYCKICKQEFTCYPDMVLKGLKHITCRDFHRHLTHEMFIQEAKNKNKNLKVLGYYRNLHEKISVECLTCGKVYDILPQSILNGVQCRDCYEKNLHGSNHPRWNPNITQEEREIGRKYLEYYRWIGEVRKRDDNTCWITGIKDYKNTEVHHVDGYNWCKEKRTDVDNGITLLTTIHKEFHDMFGRGNNTKQQFIEFLDYKKSNNSINEDKYNNLLQFLTE